MGAGGHDHHAHGGEEQERVVLRQVFVVVLQVLERDEHGERGAQDKDQVEDQGEVVHIDHAGKVQALMAPEEDGLKGGYRQAQERQDGGGGAVPLGGEGVRQEDGDARHRQGDPGADGRQAESRNGKGHLATP